MNLPLKPGPKPGIYPHHLRQANLARRAPHVWVDGVEGKICSVCQKWQSLIEFGKRSVAPDRLENRCKKCTRRRALEYYNRNKESINEQRRDPEFRAKRRPWFSAYEKRKRETDPSYRIKKSLRISLWKAIRGERKSAHMLDLLGCSLQEFMLHLEAQFTEGMTWENYGKHGWEIDHIRPCASFDLTRPENQRSCFHFSNMQPLWGPDNWRKGDRW